MKFVLCQGRHEHKDLEGLPALVSVDQDGKCSWSPEAKQYIHGVMAVKGCHQPYGVITCKALDLYITGYTPALIWALSQTVFGIWNMYQYDRDTDSSEIPHKLQLGQLISTPNAMNIARCALVGVDTTVPYLPVNLVLRYDPSRNINSLSE